MPRHTRKERLKKLLFEFKDMRRSQRQVRQADIEQYGDDRRLKMMMERIREEGGWATDADVSMLKKMEERRKERLRRLKPLSRYASAKHILASMVGGKKK